MYGQEWINQEYEKIDAFVIKCNVMDDMFSDAIKHYLQGQLPHPIVPGHPIQHIDLSEAMDQIWQYVKSDYEKDDTIEFVATIFESEYEAFKCAYYEFMNGVIDGTTLFLQYIRFDAVLDKLDVLVSVESEHVPNGIEEINLIQWQVTHAKNTKEAAIIALEDDLKRFDVLLKYLKQALDTNDEKLMASIGMYLSLLGLSLSRTMNELKDY